MKPSKVKASTYIGFNKENSNEDPRFEFDDFVSVSKYKNIFVNVILPISAKKFL